MSEGALPPEVAEVFRYHNSQDRGLMFQCFRVAKIENIIADKRPLHRAPEP
jgi:hypothetical protein